MNKVELIGRVTKDIELRYTANTQKAVAKFTLAVNRMKKDSGADFISCTAWGKTAEIMEKYVHKGDRVGVTGRIQTGSYEGRNGKVYTTDVIVEELDFLEKKQSNPQQANTQPQAEEEIPDEFAYIDEELPF